MLNKMRMKILSKPLLTSLVVLASFNACDVNRLDTPPLDLTEDGLG